MNVLPMKDFSIEINKHSSNTKKLGNFSANIGKLSPILMSLLLLLTHASASLDPNRGYSIRSPRTLIQLSGVWLEAKIKMNNCVCFCLVHKTAAKESPEKREAVAAKNKTSGIAEKEDEPRAKNINF